VAIEKDRARNGRSIEVVGTYNPRTNPATVDLKHDRIAYWRSVGAQFSTIVEKLVAKNPISDPFALLTAPGLSLDPMGYSRPNVRFCTFSDPRPAWDCHYTRADGAR
jgi:small subunit ribosomal protein S16